MFLKAVILLAVASSAVASPVDDRRADQRSLSLFAVVSFPNDECTSTDDADTKGICMSTTECSDKGGQTDAGNCGSGFGVCCIFKVSCNEEVKNNCTYIENDGYPNAISITTTQVTCESKIKLDNSGEICQLRLDFSDVDLSLNANNEGACDGSITVTSPTGRNPPALCGKLSGEHIYVETGTSSTDVSVKVLSGTVAGNKKWRIKVSQIECSSEMKPPADCAQYHTGPSGMFQSFNWEGQLLTQDQEYTICFRQEMGFCSVSFSEYSGAATTKDAFNINISAIANDNANVEVTACPLARLSIPSTTGSSFFCGDNFGTIDEDTISGTVRGEILPFRVNFIATAANLQSSKGFKLAYSQIPC